MIPLPLALVLAAGNPAPPGTSLADELRRARDDEAALDDRLAAARRAYGKAATAETTALFKAAFLDVERDLLAHTTSFERLRATCPSPDAAPTGVEACVRELVARTSATAALIDVQGDEIVSVVRGVDDGALFVVHAVVRRALQQRGALALDLEVSRQRMPRDAALERALLTKLPAARADAFTGPVLSRPSREVLAALPDRYLELAGAAGHRALPEACPGGPAVRALEHSWLGQAQLASTMGGATTRQVVFDAWRVERGAELALLGRRAPLRVTWPTVERDVAELDGVAWGTSDAFPRAPGLSCPR